MRIVLRLGLLLAAVSACAQSTELTGDAVDVRDDGSGDDGGLPDGDVSDDDVSADDVSDAVADVTDDIADVPDTLPDGEPPFSGISCGWGICTEGEVCCVTSSPTAEECTAPGACSGDFVLTCDGSEDCAEGELCCMPSGAILQTTCAPACASGLPMCHDVAECDDGDPGTFDYCHPSMCIYPMFERGTICVHSRNENCTNAVDDDGDTMIDVADPDCSTFPC